MNTVSGVQVVAIPSQVYGPPTVNGLGVGQGPISGSGLGIRPAMWPLSCQT
jgi:hypothetical protein